ncbi:hypothetical protein PVAND_017117 [Polypedilum vanderplanki]|uniref:GPI ethanolamine phosphate transferase 1 n=1 Tax=Polypedilum vanderplanki TaxID=319348 RepID=A0A9J6BH64_POLVA|nr:hypothetical protein PVAND_017117 [Polypedilum vanderplanki]
MKFLVTFAIFLHFLFLLSIFYIYFRTIIVQDLKPLKSLDNPPAKRLVLIVSDGLRAESFFDQNYNRTPFLKNILLTRGLIGVSHTHVPTESRPGHVALIAGVYEDPSSIFKGWQENFVEFDSVFNRSQITYAWGSPDIVPMFSKGATPNRVITETYDSNSEIFGANAPTFLLDKWVFDRVKIFLNTKAENLKEKSGVIFFLHLLGMDTSGHVHKPHSEKFTENLKFVDRGIGEIVEMIDKIFDDNLTAFIFTSDHGMTNRGSHGAGHQHETETPFLAWGAGINYWKIAKDDFLTRTHITIDGQNIPRYDIQQADAAPLMATLIGSAVPTNSHGKLPYMYPNVSKIYLANAFSNNAYQLHAMYQKLHEQALLKTFKFSFNTKESKLEDEINFLDEQIKLSFTLKDYDDIIVKSHDLIKAVHEAIDYFQMYYKNELLVSLTLAMAGWIALLYQFIIKSSITLKMNRKIFITGSAIIGVIIFYNFLQHAPLVVIGYFILPVIIWMIVVSNFDGNSLQNLRNQNHLMIAIICIIFAELLVYSFFERRILSLILILYTGSITAYAIRKKLEPKLKTLKYFSSAVCLGIFPLLKVVDKENKNSILLALGTIFWIFRSMDYVYLKRSSKISILQTILLFTGGHFILYVVFHLDAGNNLEFYQQIISWILLLSPILIIFGPTNMEIKLKLIGNGFSIAYILMSISYEPLFLLSFFVHIYSWVEMELIIFRRMKQLKDFEFETLKDERRRKVDFNDIRCVLVFLLYLLISFFGTGNMATVSSFDPNWVRCLVIVFSPFLMTILIIIKLAIPIKLLSCCFRAIHIALRVDTKKVFILMLIICDIMCLNFLYLVKNKGSWLDIGTSLSHFIIMEATVVILILFYGLAHFLTSFQIGNKRETKLE